MKTKASPMGSRNVCKNGSLCQIDGEGNLMGVFGHGEFVERARDRLNSGFWDEFKREFETVGYDECDCIDFREMN